MDCSSVSILHGDHEIPDSRERKRERAMRVSRVTYTRVVASHGQVLSMGARGFDTSAYSSVEYVRVQHVYTWHIIPQTGE